MTAPDTLYVEGKPYRVLQGGLRLARDGVVRDAQGREVREPCVDPARAATWLETGVATQEPPVSPKKKTTRERAGTKNATRKKGGD